VTETGVEAEPLVPNPLYLALQRLRNAVASAELELCSALAPAVSTMAAGTAWKGPGAATDFATELEGRHTSLPGLVGAILADIDAKLAGMEREIPASQARGIRQVMRVDGYY
jgi:hypothetical protein